MANQNEMDDQDRKSTRIDIGDLFNQNVEVQKVAPTSTHDDTERQFDLFAPTAQQPVIEKTQEPPNVKPIENVPAISDLSSVNFGNANQNEDLLDIAQQNSSGMRDYVKFLAKRIIDIEQPETISENFLTSYKLYTIRSRKGSSQEYDTIVRRRFSDFEFLQNQLLMQYGGCILPVLPQKNFWACLNLQGSQYVHLRLKRLTKYLTTLMQNPSIRMSRQLKLFLFVDSNEFSEQKGEFEEKVKVQDRVYSFLQSAVDVGQSLISGLFNRQATSPAVLQSASNLSLTQYEMNISAAYKTIVFWKKQMELRKRQYMCIKSISSLLDRKANINKKKPSKYQALEEQFEVLMNQFQDLADFVESCRQALNRRNTLAFDLENLKIIQENTLKKNKNNPRSKQVDLVKTKIKKTQQMLQRWTMSLIDDIAKAVHRVKQMLGKFIQNYVDYRHTQYSL